MKDWEVRPNEHGEGFVALYRVKDDMFYMTKLPYSVNSLPTVYATEKRAERAAKNARSRKGGLPSSRSFLVKDTDMNREQYAGLTEFSWKSLIMALEPLGAAAAALPEGSEVLIFASDESFYDPEERSLPKFDVFHNGAVFDQPEYPELRGLRDHDLDDDESSVSREAGWIFDEGGPPPTFICRPEDEQKVREILATYERVCLLLVILSPA